MTQVLPEGAKLLFSAAEVDAAIDRLAVALALELWEAHPILVCMMTGGLPFTGDLLRRFHFPLELDYLHATRYPSSPGKDETSGGEIHFERDLQRDISGRTVVLADDVLDGGVTLATAQQHLAEKGPERVISAVMVRKDVPNAKASADYVALEAPDEFLVGRGMDAGGAFRQLSGIYSLPAVIDRCLG